MTQTPPTSQPSPPDQNTAQIGAVLVLGEGGGLGAALLRRLQQGGTPAASALDLSDGEASEMLREGEWRAVAVVTRDDAHALRLTLLSAHVRPDLPLWVTMFDHTVSRELEHVAPKVHVLSPSEIVAGDLAEGCLAEAGDKLLGHHRHGVRIVDDALRLLVVAGAGLFAALVVEMVITMIAFHHGIVDAFYFSTRSVATVAGPPKAEKGPAWFKIVSAANMVAAVALVAIFTAALVRRLSRRRLTTLFGPRAAPARNHVVLVGFGQVGFRLAQTLHERGVAVVAIERDVGGAQRPPRQSGRDPGRPRPRRRPRGARTGRHQPLRRRRRGHLRRPGQRRRRPRRRRPPPRRPDRPPPRRRRGRLRDRLPAPPRPHLRRPQTGRRDDAAGDRSRR